MLDNLESKILVVYFSSKSNNTHRFIQKLELNNIRIPKEETDPMPLVSDEYVLFVPTYGGGGDDTKGSVPKQVIKFLNIEENRKKCIGVIASGNTNFGNTYCLAGDIISAKLKVPYLYNYELIGTAHDVLKVKEILTKLWRNRNE